MSLSEIKSDHGDGVVRRELASAESVRRPEQPAAPPHPRSKIDARQRRCAPGSHHDPKIFGRYDARIVGGQIIELRPIPRNFSTEETERRVGELGACGVAFAVRDMFVRDAPQPLGQVRIWAAGRDEQLAIFGKRGSMSRKGDCGTSL